ncbi:Der GTPase-activating protein YihI [Rheinheimera sp. WS51]|uniref:Der GTPase-activating protein YihI n=1 Tax=Rheinheimera sp. WS51 TaxID=3425886 RepID=UPI003D8B90F5
MTRQKKTRSAVSNGLRHLAAEDARKTRQPKEQTKKKGAGLKSGNRNSLVSSKADSSNQANKDKRLGSKTPIPLHPVAEAETKEQLQPRASLTKAKPIPLAPEVELAEIENDSYLQQLLEKVEQDEILTGKDAKYFNAKTKRLAELLTELGLDQEEDEPEDALSTFAQKDWRKDLLGDDD